MTPADTNAFGHGVVAGAGGLALIAAVIASFASPSDGKLDGRCYGNDTCDAGLVCMAGRGRDVCVKPKPTPATLPEECSR